VEQDEQGNRKILRTIFKPHRAQVEFFSATERHVLLHGNRGCGKMAAEARKSFPGHTPACRGEALTSCLANPRDFTSSS